MGQNISQKKKTIQLIVTSESFTYLLSLPGMEEMVMGILFSIMINQKIIKEDGIQTNPGSFEETLLSNACNDSGAKEIIDKVISGGKS